MNRFFKTTLVTFSVATLILGTMSFNPAAAEDEALHKKNFYEKHVREYMGGLFMLSSGFLAGTTMSLKVTNHDIAWALLTYSQYSLVATTALTGALWATSETGNYFSKEFLKFLKKDQVVWRQLKKQVKVAKYDVSLVEQGLFAQLNDSFEIEGLSAQGKATRISSLFGKAIELSDEIKNAIAKHDLINKVESFEALEQELINEGINIESRIKSILGDDNNTTNKRTMMTLVYLANGLNV